MREFESRVMRGKSEVEVVVEALFLSHEHNLAAVDRAAEEDMRQDDSVSTWFNDGVRSGRYGEDNSDRNNVQD